jgi:hypothetical protein
VGDGGGTRGARIGVTRGHAARRLPAAAAAGPRGALALLHRLATALVSAGFGLALGAYNGGEIGLSSGFTLGIGAGWLSGKLGSRLDDRLFALVPRPPRTRREALDLPSGC